MKKIFLVFFSIFFLSSCYETKIDKNAILYDGEIYPSITITANASLSTVGHYFGNNSTESNSAASNTTAETIDQNMCISSYSIDVSSAASAGTSVSASLNINEVTITSSEILGLKDNTGHFEKHFYHSLGQGDRIRFELSGSPTLTGTFSATINIYFSECK